MAGVIDLRVASKRYGKGDTVVIDLSFSQELRKKYVSIVLASRHRPPARTPTLR